MAPWASGTRYSLPRHTHLCGSCRHPCAARKRGEARLQGEEEGVGGASASEPSRSLRPRALPPPLGAGGRLSVSSSPWPGGGIGMEGDGGGGQR